LLYGKVFENKLAKHFCNCLTTQLFFKFFQGLVTMEIGHLGVLAASLAREVFNHSSASIRVWQVPTYEHADVEL